MKKFLTLLTVLLMTCMVMSFHEPPKNEMDNSVKSEIVKSEKTVLLHSYVVCPPTTICADPWNYSVFSAQMDELVTAMSAGGFYTDVYWTYNFPVRPDGIITIPPCPPCATVYFNFILVE